MLIAIFNYFNINFYEKKKKLWQEKNPQEFNYCSTDGVSEMVFMETHYVQAHVWIMWVINVWINQSNPFLIFFVFSTENPFNAAGEINQKYLKVFFLFWKLSTPTQCVDSKIAARDEWRPSSPKWFLCFSIFQLSIGFFLAPCTHNIYQCFLTKVLNKYRQKIYKLLSLNEHVKFILREREKRGRMQF